MEDALAAGRLPTSSELALWTHSDRVQQLSFPELSVRAECDDAAALLAQVRAHDDAVRDLLAWLGSSVNPDESRARALLQVLHDHPGERVVAFAEYADTVAVLFRELRHRVRVAALNASGAEVAGGRMTRRELLGRFALPNAQTAAAETIELLLTTDVLSEGVNLQTASVVVHLDLAWNPARLEQRVGRLRRIGAAREQVTVYACAPPASAERLLQMEARLRAKMNAAARSVGLAGTILPALASAPAVTGNPSRAEERIAALLSEWRDASVAFAEAGGPVRVAAVRSTVDAVIACVIQGDVPALLIARDGAISADREKLALVLAAGTGGDTPCDDQVAHTAIALVRQHLRQRDVAGVIDLTALHVARSRRDVLRRLDSIARRSPRHEQPRLAPLMHSARSAAVATLSAGAERVLGQLARADMGDDAWLQALGEFASIHASASRTADRIVALLILRAV